MSGGAYLLAFPTISISRLPIFCNPANLLFIAMQLPLAYDQHMGILIKSRPEILAIDPGSSPYSPELTADLETAHYLVPGTRAKDLTDFLIARGVTVAELLVSSAWRHHRQLPDIDSDTGLPVTDVATGESPIKSHEYQAELDIITTILSSVVSLRSAPLVTACDWENLLSSEARHRVESEPPKQLPAQVINILQLSALRQL
jgi:hypothetical protein